MKLMQNFKGAKHGFNLIKLPNKTLFHYENVGILFFFRVIIPSLIPPLLGFSMVQSMGLSS
jgi:hypothetical protein